MQVMVHHISNGNGRVQKQASKLPVISRAALVSRACPRPFADHQKSVATAGGYPLAAFTRSAQTLVIETHGSQPKVPAITTVAITFRTLWGYAGFASVRPLRRVSMRWPTARLRALQNADR